MRIQSGSIKDFDYFLWIFKVLYRIFEVILEQILPYTLTHIIKLSTKNPATILRQQAKKQPKNAKKHQ